MIITKSEEYKNKLKGVLKDLTDNIDDIYYAMRKELEDEILERKERIIKIDNETKRIYGLLTEEKCEKLIKTKVPLRIKMFNKIKSHGKGIENTGWISINFCFNNDYNCFSYNFTINEIKRLLNIKDSD